MDFLQIFMWPFSALMTLLYNVFNNYGLTLIVFALLVKVLLFPISIKGKRSMIQMNMLQGRMKQIQTQYANNREKANQEIQALYAKENVNPMGGCLWSMLPLMILLPLYAVVRRPLRYLMSLSDVVISEITEAVSEMGVVLNAGYPEISIVSAMNNSPEVLEAAQNIAGAELFGMNFNFFGIDLSAVPNLTFWSNGLAWATIGLFLIPVISAVCSYYSSHIMMKTNNVNQGSQENPMANNKMMLWMSPVMSLYIGFIMPAGMGIYWIANSLFAVVQELVAGRMLKKDYAAARVAREKQEAEDKLAEKAKRRESMERKAEAIASGKKKSDKKGQQEAKKKDTAAIDASGVGTRAYARGRAYDPNRYSSNGPTAYAGEVAEEVVEAPVEETPILETPVVSAPVVETNENPWAGIDQAMDEMENKTEE